MVRGESGTRDQWEQMASRAKGIISYSMDFGGYVDISVYLYFGRYVDILDPWIIEDMSIYRCVCIGLSICRYMYICYSISVYRYIDMSIYRFVYIGLSIGRYIGLSISVFDISVYLHRFSIWRSVYR